MDIHSDVNDKKINNKKKTVNNGNKIITISSEDLNEQLNENNVLTHEEGMVFFNDTTIIMEEHNAINNNNNDNKKCYLCEKLFDPERSILRVLCETCVNWYCGCENDDNDIDDSYYCASCFGPQIGKNVFTPTKTSSPLRCGPARNDIIRMVRQNQKKAREDMLETNNKGKKFDN